MERERGPGREDIGFSTDEFEPPMLGGRLWKTCGKPQNAWGKSWGNFPEIFYFVTSLGM
jgi:hypothetical protein